MTDISAIGPKELSAHEFTVWVVDIGIIDGSVNPGCSNNPLERITKKECIHFETMHSSQYCCKKKCSPMVHRTVLHTVAQTS